MNLDKKKIRELLADFYKEGCLDVTVDMKELTELLEYLAAKTGDENPFEVWRKIKLDINTYNRRPYVEIITEFVKKYQKALSKQIIESVNEALINTSSEEAFSIWHKAYMGAYVHWETTVCQFLCEESFNFKKDQQQKVDQCRQLNYFNSNTHWIGAKPLLLERSEDKSLSEEVRSKLFIIIGQIELYHILPNHELALNYFKKAETLHNDDNVQRAIGEYFMRKGQFDEAKEQFLLAVEMDPNDLENYHLMGDCYREESKFSAAEQWYEDSIHINFLATAAYRRKFILFCQPDYSENKESERTACIEMLKKIIPKSGKDHTRYDTYRDISYGFSIYGNFDEALAYINNAIAINPDLAPAYVDSGYVYVRQQQFAKAEGEFIKAKEIIADWFEVYWGLSYVYESMENWDAAIKNYLECLKLRPNNSELIHSYLGNCYGKANQYVKSLEHYITAHELNPNNSSYKGEISKLYADIGVNEQLEAFLKRDIDKDPNSPTPYNQLGVYYSKSKQYAKALEAFQKTVKLDDSEAVYYENLGLTYEALNQPNAAEEMYAQAITKDEESGVYLNRMGYFLTNQKKNGAAIDYYKRAIEREPESIRYLNNLAITYNHLKQWDKAEPYFQKVLEIDDNDTLAHSELGLSLIWQRKFEKAKEHIQKALKLNPNNHITYEYLAYMAQEEGAFSDAYKFVSKGLAIEPDDAALNNRAGIAKFNLNQIDDAINFYQKAIDKNPEVPDYYNNLGLALEKTDDKIAANLAFEKAKGLKGF